MNDAGTPLTSPMGAFVVRRLNRDGRAMFYHSTPEYEGWMYMRANIYLAVEARHILEKYPGAELVQVG